ncbi:hypothetical protein LAZ67_21001930 [Cordylochernes scorpioides]|uniref:GIY-YIG domain-containing protein n=1 Tax=Cordylochernes scorpioides TaxID=51811 RepID=A0ABY6LMG8_9ARAC|nr:hypothetical protein LAZ67_21001930 [Cordylochernes scorpioides]
MTYRSLCFLPYSPSSVDIARKLKSYGIRTIYKNSPNLLSSLRHPHTKSSAPPDPLRSMGAVYSVSCEQCPATYVGETGRSLAIRMTEHSRNISRQDTKSLIYQHMQSTGHTFNINNPTIHYRHIHILHQRLILESIVSELFTLRVTKNTTSRSLHEFMDVCNKAIRNLKTRLLSRSTDLLVIWEGNVIKSLLLNLEEFTTLLCQIEACLNSRPLMELSPDPIDLRALTQGNFLIGSPLNDTLGLQQYDRADLW